MHTLYLKCNCFLPCWKRSLLSTVERRQREDKEGETDEKNGRNLLGFPDSQKKYVARKKSLKESAFHFFCTSLFRVSKRRGRKGVCEKGRREGGEIIHSEIRSSCGEKRQRAVSCLFGGRGRGNAFPTPPLPIFFWWRRRRKCAPFSHLSFWNEATEKAEGSSESSRSLTLSPPNTPLSHP